MPGRAASGPDASTGAGTSGSSQQVPERAVRDHAHPAGAHAAALDERPAPPLAVADHAGERPRGRRRRAPPQRPADVRQRVVRGEDDRDARRGEPVIEAPFERPDDRPLDVHDVGPVAAKRAAQARRSPATCSAAFAGARAAGRRPRGGSTAGRSARRRGSPGRRAPCRGRTPPSTASPGGRGRRGCAQARGRTGANSPTDRSAQRAGIGCLSLRSSQVTTLPAHVVEPPVAAPRGARDRLCATGRPALVRRRGVRRHRRRPSLPARGQRLDQQSTATASVYLGQPLAAGGGGVDPPDSAVERGIAVTFVKSTATLADAARAAHLTASEAARARQRAGLQPVGRRHRRQRVQDAHRSPTISITVEGPWSRQRVQAAAESLANSLIGFENRYPDVKRSS